MNPDDGGLEGLESLGLLPPQQAVVGALAPGMPAQAAGMEVGDRIVITSYSIHYTKLYEGKGYYAG